VSINALPFFNIKGVKMHTTCVHVYRVDHKDYVLVTRSLLEKYPDKFKIIDDENTEELNVVKVTKGKKTKK
jgi:hypothetical protein